MTVQTDYLNQLRLNPRETVKVIIRTQEMAHTYQHQVTQLGLTITQTFSLVPGFAAVGPASAIITLADESWVLSIEPDQPLQAMI